MLKEETREHEFLIYEDDHGTHIMTGYNLCLIDHLKKLINLKIDVLRIDSFLHDEA
jgi:putative protease